MALLERKSPIDQILRVKASRPKVTEIKRKGQLRGFNTVRWSQTLIRPSIKTRGSSFKQDKDNSRKKKKKKGTELRRKHVQEKYLSCRLVGEMGKQQG